MLQISYWTLLEEDGSIGVSVGPRLNEMWPDGSFSKHSVYDLVYYSVYYLVYYSV